MLYPLTQTLYWQRCAHVNKSPGRGDLCNFLILSPGVCCSFSSSSKKFLGNYKLLRNSVVVTQRHARPDNILLNPRIHSAGPSTIAYAALS
jgi:hypothetical protein